VKCIMRQLRHLQLGRRATHLPHETSWTEAPFPRSRCGLQIREMRSGIWLPMKLTYIVATLLWSDGKSNPTRQPKHVCHKTLTIAETKISASGWGTARSELQKARVWMTLTSYRSATWSASCCCGAASRSSTLASGRLFQASSSRVI
jgi:hypothetical protein